VCFGTCGIGQLGTAQTIEGRREAEEEEEERKKESE
jgi:hypothetical protein